MSRVSAIVLALLVLAARPLSAQGVRGRVLEDGTGQPIAGATVTVLDGRGRGVGRAQTDAAGAFAVPVRRAGYYQLRAERLGYRTVTSARIAASPAEVVELELRMSTQTVVMDPLTVVARPRPRTVPEQRMADFEWRRRQIPSGRFLGPEEIRRIRPFYTTDVLQQVPSVSVTGGLRRAVLLPTRFVSATGGRRCRPTIYVNGVRFRMMGDDSIDDLAPGTRVQAVEVYLHPAQAPIEFPALDNPYCGVVVIWTGLNSNHG